MNGEVGGELGLLGFCCAMCRSSRVACIASSWGVCSVSISVHWWLMGGKFCGVDLQVK